MFDSKKFLSDVSHEPGVYRMYDDKDQVIYVGKAKESKKAPFQLLPKKLKQQKTEALGVVNSSYWYDDYFFRNWSVIARAQLH